MSTRLGIAALALLATTTVAAVEANAAKIRVACYSDGNECEATEELSARFINDNPDIEVVIDKMPYKSILESLPVQLAAGNGPDVARVTIAGPIMKYFLDLTLYLKDPGYWETNFGAMLPWLRPNATYKGIYGLPTQMTVTAPIVNKTLFEQAGMPLPGPEATWDDWAAAVAEVAKATNTPFGMAWDRSGHRFAAPAVLAIFSIMWRWNEFLWPMVVLHRSESFTLQFALNSFQGDLTTQWNYLLAMTVLTLLPVTVMFLLLQRYITQGIASAGIK